MRSGSDDELDGALWVIVRDREGAEHNARLSFETVDLVPGDRGAITLDAGRGPRGHGL